MRPTLILACIAVLGLSGGGWAADPTAEALAALKEKMPKDQKAHAERSALINQLQQDSATETNGLKKDELTGRMRSEANQLNADLKKLSQTGVKNWVGKCGAGSEGSQLVQFGTKFFGIILYDGLNEASRQVLRKAKEGDVIRFTVKPSKKSGLSQSAPYFDGAAVTSVEIVK